MERVVAGASSDVVSAIPFPPDPDFVDRPDITAQLREKCHQPGSRVGLVGTAGVGKTQLAIRYAYDIRRESPDTHIFWVHATTNERFEEAYFDIACQLRLLNQDKPGSDALSPLYDWLCDEANGKWLMILDDAVDDILYAHSAATRRPLASFLPKGRNGTILVTSRSMEAAERLTGNVIPVWVMEKDEGQKLLRNKLGQNYDDEVGADLLRALEYVPLAISQAAAYINIRAPQMSMSAYLDRFRRSNDKFHARFHEDIHSFRRDLITTNSVTTTWQITFQQIRREKLSAADLLCFMSFFNPQGIPDSAIRGFMDERDSGNVNQVVNGDNRDIKDIKFDEDLAILREYSLITVQTWNKLYEMHTLVQFRTQAWLSSFGDTERWRRKFLNVISREYHSGSLNGNWSLCEELEPHIQAVMEQEPAIEEAETLAQLLMSAGCYRWMKRDYEIAEERLRKAVKANTMALGIEHVETLQSLALLAAVIEAQGRYAEANQMQRQALDGYRKVIRNNHLSVNPSVKFIRFMLRFIMQAPQLHDTWNFIYAPKSLSKDQESYEFQGQNTRQHIQRMPPHEPQQENSSTIIQKSQTSSRGRRSTPTKVSPQRLFKTQLDDLFRNLAWHTCKHYELDRVAAELRYISPRDIRIDWNDPVSHFDRAKGFVEDWTGEKWDWWPLKPRKKALRVGEARITWKCTCGTEGWAEVSVYVGRKVDELINRHTGDRGSGSSNSRNSQNGQQTRSSSQDIPMQNMGSTAITGNSSSPSITTSSTQPDIPSQHQGVNSHQPNTNSGHILLVVRAGRENFLSQIMVNQNSEEFFRILRTEYFRLRGLLPTFFSVWRYSHCDFYKFQKWGEYMYAAKQKDHFPNSSNTDYCYKPKPRDDIPPILPHEFYYRFYACYKPRPWLHWYHTCRKFYGHDTEVLNSFPKKRSKLLEEGPKREKFWGIFARESICFRWVWLWNTICLSPLLAFLLLWLFKMSDAGSGDLSNASVPITLVISLLTLFWTMFLSSLNFAQPWK